MISVVRGCSHCDQDLRNVGVWDISCVCLFIYNHDRVRWPDFPRLFKSLKTPLSSLLLHGKTKRTYCLSFWRLCLSRREEIPHHLIYNPDFCFNIKQMRLMKLEKCLTVGLFCLHQCHKIKSKQMLPVEFKGHERFDMMFEVTRSLQQQPFAS